jgi:hypothetical protein
LHSAANEADIVFQTDVMIIDFVVWRKGSDESTQSTFVNAKISEICVGLTLPSV